MSLIKEMLIDLIPGDKIQIVRDEPHLAQVYEGDVCTVIRITSAALLYKDRRGYIWTFYLNGMFPSRINESIRKYVPPKIKTPLEACEKIRIYDSSLSGGSAVSNKFQVVGNDVVAFISSHNYKIPDAGFITVNKRQCAKLKKKEKKNG